MFASNIGSEHFIGLVGSGAASGLGVGAFELDATILLQLLGHVFIPVFNLGLEFQIRFLIFGLDQTLLHLVLS